jgi:hypothetical protein
LIAVFGIEIQKGWRGIDLEVVRPSNEMGVPRESSWRLQAAGSRGSLESSTVRVQQFRVGYGPIGKGNRGHAFDTGRVAFIVCKIVLSLILIASDRLQVWWHVPPTAFTSPPFVSISSSCKRSNVQLCAPSVQHSGSGQCNLMTQMLLTWPSTL